MVVCRDMTVNLKTGKITTGGGGASGEGGDIPIPEGGGGSGGGGMFAWDEDTKTIGPGGCMVGRKWYTCTTGTGSNKSDGLYQLKVVIGVNSATLEVVSGKALGESPNANICYIPIYQITNGKIAADYRGAFVVPCWE